MALILKDVTNGLFVWHEICGRELEGLEIEGKFFFMVWI